MTLKSGDKFSLDVVTLWPGGVTDKPSENPPKPLESFICVDDLSISCAGDYWCGWCGWHAGYVTRIGERRHRAKIRRHQESCAMTRKR